MSGVIAGGRIGEGEAKVVRVALLTVSDTRTLATDSSGDLLEAMVESAGHVIAGRTIVSDDAAGIAETVRVWCTRDDVDVVITTGGTGLSGRDVTPEAVEPLFDKRIEGFAVVFHLVSYQSVGLSTMASRATAGLVGTTYVFCLPGSNGAVRDGWEKVIAPQLDSRHRPCNLVDMMPRLGEDVASPRQPG
ncbi:molybdenum cofactor biosynthesis protein B [Sphingomonas sp. TX0543]|uniref:molybdenum cofactor biosynthesis protein B n=1 Tax=Sphingomonas sp. TX0543 TaxID=3399682 RepID=UPI003AFAB808